MVLDQAKMKIELGQVVLGFSIGIISVHTVG